VTEVKPPGRAGREAWDCGYHETRSWRRVAGRAVM